MVSYFWITPSATTPKITAPIPLTLKAWSTGTVPLSFFVFGAVVFVVVGAVDDVGDHGPIAAVHKNAAAIAIGPAKAANATSRLQR